MSKPTLHPRLTWSDKAGLLGSEAQRIMRSLIDLTFNRTGLDASAVVTGTAGTAGNLSAWNANGDLVDANAAVGAMPDNTFRIVDNGDQSKKLAFEVSGVTTAITRTLTVPNASGTIALTSDLTSGYQPLDADLTSWAAITRASGYDTFATTPNSANLRTLVTDESGTGALLFAGGALGAATATSLSFGQSTFNFFEQGTFTPAFSSTAATFSYATQTGRYLRIGPYVFYSIYIGLNTSGNTLTANALSVTGFPYTVLAASVDRYRAAMAWFASTSNYVSLALEMNQGATTALVTGATAAATGNATGQASNAALHATNGSVLIAHGFYEV